MRCSVGSVSQHAVVFCAFSIKNRLAAVSDAPTASRSGCSLLLAFQIFQQTPFLYWNSVPISYYPNRWQRRHLRIVNWFDWIYYAASTRASVAPSLSPIKWLLLSISSERCNRSFSIQMQVSAAPSVKVNPAENLIVRLSLGMGIFFGSHRFYRRQ